MLPAALAAALACAGPAPAAEPFSFAVFGDSRIPAYAPYDRDHREHLDRLVAKVAHYAEAGAKPEYQALYDPQSGLLARLEVGGGGGEPAQTLIYGDDGWPRVMVKRVDGRPRITLRAEGQRWVYDNLVRRLRRGAEAKGAGPSFCLHTGDMVYFGFQGRGLRTSPYWRDLDARFLSRLPAGGPGGLAGRFFPAVGNHEAWGDPELVGFRQAFPYLADHGFTADERAYHFDHQNARFIFLDTGTMDPEAPADWYNSRPGFDRQMELLAAWLEEAAEQGRDHAFITFHNPAFCRSGFGPLPAEHNPHPVIRRFADRLDITVFNGHNHATELYQVDGVRYLVLGGGGGEQNLDKVLEMPAGYPEELYWRGQPRKLEYNYALVRVSPDGVRIRLQRFRPNEFEPFAAVEVTPGIMD
jgi:hypothetical protein